MSKRFYTENSVVRLSVGKDLRDRRVRRDGSAAGEQGHDYVFQLKDRVNFFFGDQVLAAKTDGQTGLQDIYPENEEAGELFQGSFYKFKLIVPKEALFKGMETFADIESEDYTLSWTPEKKEDKTSFKAFSTQLYGESLVGNQDFNRFFDAIRKLAKKEFIDYMLNVRDQRFIAVAKYLDGDFSQQGIDTPPKDKEGRQVPQTEWFYEDGPDLLNCIFGDPKIYTDAEIDEKKAEIEDPDDAEFYETDLLARGQFSRFFVSDEFHVDPKGTVFYLQANLLVGLTETRDLEFLQENYDEDPIIPPKPESKEKLRPKKPKVYNDGTSEPKNTEEVNAEKELTPEQKREIHEKVKNKLNQLSDSAFLNAVVNAGEIRTLEDVYDLVLNVLPINGLIDIAVDCVKKYLPDENYPAKACDVILKNLSIEETRKMLEWADLNAATNFIAQQFVENVRGKFNDEVGNIPFVPLQFKDFLNSEFNSTLNQKDIICSVLFASVPAALALLFTMDSDNAEKLMPNDADEGVKRMVKNLSVENLTKRTDTLENPTKPVLEAMGQNFSFYKGLAYTKDISDALLKILLDFIDQLVVQTVANVMQEIAYLCEGSSKSDFANAKPGAPVFDPNSLDDLITNPNIDNDLKDKVKEFSSDVDEEEIKQLLKDLLDDISSLLTISEICALFSDPQPKSMSYRMALDKVWYGLLGLDKYIPLRSVVNSKNRLIELLEIISEEFDQVLCAQKIEDLTKTKKLLAELCEPNTDDLLIQNLKNSLTDDALEKYLQQEDDFINDLLKSIGDIQKAGLGLANRPLFCGPEADASGMEPFLDTAMHPSSLHLDKKEMQSAFISAQTFFESEISTFKSIMTKPAFNVLDTNNFAGSFDGVFNAASNVSDVMKNLYSGGEPPEGLISSLNQIVSDYGIVAKKVYDTLINISGDNIQTNFVGPGSKVLEITMSPNNQLTDDYLKYIVNFGSDTYLPETFNIPPGYSKLFYNASDSNQATVFETQLVNVDPVSGNSPFSETIQDTNTTAYGVFVESLIESRFFFGSVVEQIIKEHAEYITSGTDLFNRSSFDKLVLNKNNPCDPNSFFYFKDIIDSLFDMAKAIECVVGFANVPTASEMAKIYSLFQAYVRVVTVNEMMKSFFVFASFGIDSLMPSVNQDDEYSSFYFGYLSDQIRKRLQADQLLIQGGALQEVVKMAYYSKNKNKIDNPDNVNLNEALKQMASEAAISVQRVFKLKLEEVGFDTKNLGTLQDEFNLFFSIEPSDANSQYKQMLNNVLAHDVQTVPYLNPPTVEAINYEEKYITIPAGYYSNYQGLNGRLANGGFFIEKGIDVRHAFKPDDKFGTPAIAGLQTGIFTEEDYVAIRDNLFDSNPNETEYTKEQFRDDVKGETDIAKYLFGGLNPGSPAYNTNELFINLPYSRSGTQFIDLINRQGTIAILGPIYEKYKTTMSPPGLAAPLFSDVKNIDNFISDVTKLSGLETATLFSFYSDLLSPSENYFKKFQVYTSLNLLIPIEELESVEQNEGILSLINAAFPAGSTTDESEITSRKAFIEAAFDKKYFIKEAGPNGREYFKLPIIKNIEANTILPQDARNIFIEVIAAAELSPGASVIINEFANSPEFKNLMDSIEYQNILSFVSILVTEVVDKQYPTIDLLFNKTLNVLRTAIRASLNMASRFEDLTPDRLYNKNPGGNSFIDPGLQVDFNMLTLLLENILKAVANMTDPTWQTPWFLPGPLTPFGIIAKLLAGTADIEDEDEAKQAVKPKSNDVDKSVECPPEEGSLQISDNLDFGSIFDS